jgi:uncharacterized UBP type Zn finger protein
MPQGTEDGKVEYEPVTLKECLDSFTAVEVVELTCSACGGKDGFYKRALFKTFPEVLAVNARRFNIINWVPTKVDVAVVVGDEPFDLDSKHTFKSLLPAGAVSYIWTVTYLPQIINPVAFDQTRSYSQKMPTRA